MNPATTDNTCNNKWNQTADLTIPADKNCFKINAGEWEGANGTWSVYNPPVPTTDPTNPADNVVLIFGDINLELKETDVYTGVTELQAGTYKFNVNNNGTTHGMNYTYTDRAVIDYIDGYKAQSTFNVSGGRYTFTFHAAAKKPQLNLSHLMIL